MAEQHDARNDRQHSSYELPERLGAGVWNVTAERPQLVIHLLAGGSAYEDDVGHGEHAKRGPEAPTPMV
ncbi:hypothetical protein GCM10027579_01240 [Calidifontibacter terrae]